MRNLLLCALAAAALAGCYFSEAPQPDQNSSNAAAAQANEAAPVDPAVVAARNQARSEVGRIWLQVDVSERELTILRDDQSIATHRVAVGSAEYPTPLGRWRFSHVDINPDWTPPDSEWAEKEAPKRPGEHGNPMGRARLVFHQDYSIHGTDALASLGTDQSHGSIRIANPDVLELAQLLLKAGGAWEGDDWFAGLTADPTRMHRIPLEHPVEIEVIE